MRRLPDGKAFGNINSKVMRSRQEVVTNCNVKGLKQQLNYAAVSAAQKDVLVFIYQQIIGTGQLVIYKNEIKE